MGRWVKIPWIKGVDIPWVARQNTIDRGSNTMGSGVDIPWVGGSIYHGYIFFCVSGEYFFFR
jgi:hypothetical protein